MKDYLHVAKVGQHLVVKLAQSYLKGYASTWWKTMKQEDGKPMVTHGNFSKNTLNRNSFQKTLITFQGANFMTL